VAFFVIYIGEAHPSDDMTAVAVKIVCKGEIKSAT